MRIGLTLPQFGVPAATALAAARQAEAEGLDGVFVIDHLATGDGPAVLHGPSLLAAVATHTTRVDIGTLVARVGLMPDPVLLAALTTIDVIAPGRLIAGLGVGDQTSAPEHQANGVAREPVARRYERLVALADELRVRGITVWIGGRSDAARRAAAKHADAINLWAATVDEVRSEAAAARPAAATWAGRVTLVEPSDAERLTDRFAALRAAGVSYAICSPRPTVTVETIEMLAHAAKALAG